MTAGVKKSNWIVICEVCSSPCYVRAALHKQTFTSVNYNYKNLDCRSFQMLGSYLNSSLVPSYKIDRERNGRGGGLSRKCTSAEMKWITLVGPILTRNILFWIFRFCNRKFDTRTALLLAPKRMARSFNDYRQITKWRLLRFHSLSSILPNPVVLFIFLNGSGCAE